MVVFFFLFDPMHVLVSWAGCSTPGATRGRRDRAGRRRLQTAAEARAHAAEAFVSVVGAALQAMGIGPSLTLWNQAAKGGGKTETRRRRLHVQSSAMPAPPPAGRAAAAEPELLKAHLGARPGAGGPAGR